MGDILKSVGGGWPFLVSWVLPAGIFWSVFGLFILPSTTSLPVFNEIEGTSAANQTLILAGAAILTGVIFNGISTVLYRLLEGYYLPQSSKLWRTLRQRQIKRRNGLKAQLGLVVGQNKIETTLIRERLQRYPADEGQVGPTGFANAMRAIETFGWDRYQLDSQTFWSELIAVAPENLKKEEESARSPIDFSVNFFFLSMLMALTCGSRLIIGGWSTSVFVVGVISVAVIPLWFRLAVLSTRYLASVVQALVNVGRVDLATKLGLKLPKTLEDERQMWFWLFWTVFDPFDMKYVRALDRYRKDPRDTQSEVHEPPQFICNMQPSETSAIMQHGRRRHRSQPDPIRSLPMSIQARRPRTTGPIAPPPADPRSSAAQRKSTTDGRSSRSDLGEKPDSSFPPPTVPPT